MQFAFGSGSMWGIDSGANPTPGKFGILQDVSVDFPFSNKPLFGSYQSPVAIGRGTAKPAWKAKFAQLTGRVLNSLFFGQNKATGSVLVAEDEAGAITAGSITTANSANWVDNLGVRYSATGLALVRVASAPAVGQYSVAAGVYTFNVAENGTAVKIDYTYTASGSGEKITLANLQLGSAPSFKAVFTQSFSALRQTLVLNANVASKVSIASKLEDFVMPEFDADISADSGNNLGTWSLGEAS